MITIIDYEMGNLKSVQNGFLHLGYDVKVSSQKEDIVQAQGLVLPGVGAFGQAMKNLNNLGIVEVIKDKIQKQTPFLGICLGLQLLFERSEESKDEIGLGVIPGKVVKFPDSVKVPQIGWNDLLIKKNQDRMLKGIKDSDFFYFVHSFCAVADNDKDILATSIYGKEFVAAISRGNCYGFQFHPEKSSKLGLKILKNFGEMVEMHADNSSN